MEIVIAVISIVCILFSLFAWVVYKNTISLIKKEDTITYSSKLKHLKPDQHILVKYYRIAGTGIGWCKVLHNNVKDKKLLVLFSWNNFQQAGVSQIERMIFNYNGSELKDFDTLNYDIGMPENNTGSTGEDFDLPILQSELNKALECEDYTKADQYQKQIDKLLRN